MKTTNKSNVTYIDHMGTDNSVVNAARVSFDKHHTNYTEEGNKKLIQYLAKHNHWSPFAHTSIQLKIDAPLFVARQMVKHQVGGVWNEVSRRYVDDEPVFYIPDSWRARAENKKQGSSNSVVDVSDVFDTVNCFEVCLGTYDELLKRGVAPEMARMVLPQNMITSWYWTGSLLFFHRVVKQRLDEHAQKESQELALQINDIMLKLFPVSWKALS